MKSKVSNKGKQSSKKPIVNAGQRREVHVPECMVWPDPSAVPSNAYSQSERVITTKKPEIGKPINRGYNLSTENTNPNAECVLERDTAMEAIRGWPQHQTEQEQTNEFEDFMKGYGVSGGPVPHPYKDTQIPKPKGNKKKGKSTGFKGENDANIADLMTHRFMYEAAAERQRKEAEKVRQEAEMSKMLHSKRFPKDIKANKTSQLRSIAMAEKVETRPGDLWQMSKFKNNAQPALDTKRKSGISSSKKASNGTGQKGEVFDTCTCNEEQTGYKGADYDRHQEQDYPNQIDYGDTKGADQVPMSPEISDQPMDIVAL